MEDDRIELSMSTEHNVDRKIVYSAYYLIYAKRNSENVCPTV